MGLEAATIMAISAAVSGATAAYGMSQSGKSKAPAPLAPEAPPAAEKAPDRASVKKKVSAAVGAGAPAETLLTGPAGVQLDAGILGKNTLLGG
jgi:hypothetical protein